MPTGTIKKLVKDRGFGFIRAEDGRELFFHRSALRGVEFESLSEGQSVEFDIEKQGGGRGPQDKRPRAVNVRTA